MHTYKGCDEPCLILTYTPFRVIVCEYPLMVYIWYYLVLFESTLKENSFLCHTRTELIAITINCLYCDVSSIFKSIDEVKNEWKKLSQLADKNINQSFNSSSKSPLTRVILLSFWYALKSTLFILKFSPIIIILALINHWFGIFIR